MPWAETGTKSRESAILFALAALQFVSLVDFMIVTPLGPHLLDDLGMDAGRFSWVVSAYTLAAGLAGFLAAPWLGRVPRRPAYLVATIGLLVGTVACGLATTFPQVLTARCVTGGFGGVHGGLALAIVADVFPPERGGRAMGPLMLSFAVASVVGVPLGIALGTQRGWQVPFFVLAMLGVATPLAGRLVDRVGALPVFFCVVPLSAGMMLAITHPPAIGVWGAAPVTAALMATNASRMVTATSLVTASIEPQRRAPAEFERLVDLA